MNTAHKGRRGEHRVRAILEAAGYTVVRAAASKGPVDLVAWNGGNFRLIQVKTGGGYPSAIEREVLSGLVRPANATVELWRLPDREQPIVEVLR